MIGSWSRLVALALVVGLAGVAEGKGKGANKSANEVTGTISAVADDSITVSAGHKKKGGGGQTITVTKSTPVTIDGVAGKHLADLSAGEHVKVMTSANGSASSIEATTKKAGKKKK